MGVIEVKTPEAASVNSAPFINDAFSAMHLYSNIVKPYKPCIPRWILIHT